MVNGRREEQQRVTRREGDDALHPALPSGGKKVRGGSGDQW